MPVALPHDASLHGRYVDGILEYLIWATGIAFAALALFLIFAVVFHSGPRREAAYTHGSGLRSQLIALAIGAAVFFGIDAVALVRSAERLRAGFWNFPEDDPR